MSTISNDNTETMAHTIADDVLARIQSSRWNGQAGATKAQVAEWSARLAGQDLTGPGQSAFAEVVVSVLTEQGRVRVTRSGEAVLARPRPEHAGPQQGDAQDATYTAHYVTPGGSGDYDYDGWVLHDEDGLWAADLPAELEVSGPDSIAAGAAAVLGVAQERVDATRLDEPGETREGYRVTVTG